MTQSTGTKLELHTSRLIRGWGVRRLASRKIRGPSARDDTKKKATGKKNLRAKWRSRHFAISTFHRVQGSPLPKEARNPRWVPHTIMNLFVVSQAMRQFAAGAQEAWRDFGGDAFWADAGRWSGGLNCGRGR